MISKKVYNVGMHNRHEYREKIVFTLYQHLLLHKDLNACFDDNFYSDSEEFRNTAGEDLDLKDAFFYDDYVRAVRDDLILNKESYIAEISKWLNKWTFDRLNLVEQAILLETVSEISQDLNDKAVVIDEAVILAKQYCDDESFRYINGVLDHICSR